MQTKPQQREPCNVWEHGRGRCESMTASKAMRTRRLKLGKAMEECKVLPEWQQGLEDPPHRPLNRQSSMFVVSLSMRKACT